MQTLLLCFLLADSPKPEPLSPPKAAPVTVIVVHPQTLLDRLRERRMDYLAAEFERLQEARARAAGIPPRVKYTLVCPHCGKKLAP